MVHLAPMGYVYDGTLNRQRQPQAQGGFVRPDVTFCGISVAQAVKEPVKVMLPHDHDDACKTCLKALARKQTDQVQPLLF